METEEPLLEKLHVVINSEVAGPYDLKDIQQLINAREVTPESLIHYQGEWHPASLFDGLTFPYGVQPTSTPTPSILPAPQRIVRAKLILIFAIVTPILAGIIVLFYFWSNNPEKGWSVQNSWFNGSVPQAQQWLKENLNDPDSLQIITWGKVQKQDDGSYSLRCDFRSKNSQGGYELSDPNFTFFFDAAGNVTEAGNPLEIAMASLQKDIDAKNEVAIAARKARIGMTAEQVTRALGQPSNIPEVPRQISSFVKEEWIYDGGDYVSFGYDNKVVTLSDNLNFDYKGVDNQ